MTRLLEDAVQVLRELPESVQRNAARAILEYAATYEEGCPSSGALRQFEAFVKEGSGSISVSA
jgi:hypothetical protein